MADMGLIGLAVMGQVCVCRWITVHGAHTKADGSTLHILNLGLAAQNFALNVAEHGFKISVYNRSYEKTEACVTRAGKEREWLPALGYLDSAMNSTHVVLSATFWDADLAENLHGYPDLKQFVASLKKPR